MQTVPALEAPGLWGTVKPKPFQRNIEQLSIKRAATTSVLKRAEGRQVHMHAWPVGTIDTPWPTRTVYAL